MQKPPFPLSLAAALSLALLLALPLLPGCASPTPPQDDWDRAYYQLRQQRDGFNSAHWTPPGNWSQPEKPRQPSDASSTLGKAAIDIAIQEAFFSLF